MNRILFLTRSTKDFYTQRKDYDHVIDRLLEEKYIVDIYDIKQRKFMQTNTRELYIIGIQVLSNFLSKYPLPLIVYNFACFIYFLVNKRNAYSVTHILYLREEYLLVPRIIKNTCRDLVISIYGSDINEQSLIKKLFKKIYALCSTVIVTNEDFRDKIVAKVGSGIERKITTLMIPQPHADLYKNIRYGQKGRFKEKLGIPSDKIIITIGTNINENEQHEQIFDALKHDPNLENYHLIIPLTSKITDSGRKKQLVSLISKLISSDQCSILSGFLPDEVMRDYRFASDIFINLRKYDQLALSMIESIAAYNCVITGSWLDYRHLSNNVSLQEIEEINQLPSEINRCLESMNKKVLKKNKNYVLKSVLVDNVDEWLNVYR